VIADRYRGQRICVVGGFGFIGSSLTETLLDAGAEVTVVTPARERHPAPTARVEAAGGRVLDADVRQLAAMRDAVADQDVVFNVSGQSGALASVRQPAVDLDVNCAGNLALLEALRVGAPGAKLVFAGSRLVYGAPKALPVTEDQPIAPLCPHGVHKAAVEHYLSIYNRLYGIRTTALRITNPYGPGHPSGRSAYGVINHLIQRALAGQALPIYGDGSQLRDYVFLGDVVDAMLHVGVDRTSDGRVYNIGSGTGRTMLETARLIVEIAGSGHIEHHPWPPLVREIDTGDFVADITRIASDVGWRPTFALADGLRRAIAASLAQAVPR
jgi:nucleoside-diphosphate-sugar epimerase